MGNNELLIKIPPEVLRNAQMTFDEVTGILRPYLITVTPAERLSHRKMGAGLIKFLELSHTLAVESPGLFPTFINNDSFGEEYFMTHELWLLVNKINRLRECVSDTEMLTGSRTLEIAQAFYQVVKMAARRDIPGARIIFDELKSAYPPPSRERRKQKHEEDDGQPELFGD